MESLEEVICSKDQDLVKKKSDAVHEMMTSIEKSLGRLHASSAGKLDQGQLPRLQVQCEHGSLKFQSEGEIIHEAYYFCGMDEEIKRNLRSFQN